MANNVSSFNCDSPRSHAEAGLRDSGQDPAVHFWKSVRVKTANNSPSEAPHNNIKITFSVLAL
jgi:hypothetical protein